MPTGVGEIVASVPAVRVWVLFQILCRSSPLHCGWGPSQTLHQSSPHLRQDLAWSVGVLLRRALAVSLCLSWTLIPSSLVGLWPFWGGG